MSSGEPSKRTSAVFDICIGALVAASALYGAVRIVASILVPLSVGIAIVAVVGAGFALLRWHFRRW